MPFQNLAEKEDAAIWRIGELALRLPHISAKMHALKRGWYEISAERAGTNG
jgi:hypothetical protein